VLNGMEDNRLLSGRRPADTHADHYCGNSTECIPWALAAALYDRGVRSVWVLATLCADVAGAFAACRGS
jgi:hypothetical protein